MNRSVCRCAAIGALSALMMTALASAVAGVEPAAISWTQPVSIRTADGVNLQDADFSGRNVAITWQEPGATASMVRIVTSVDGGNAFVLDVKAPASRQAAVDLCGGYELRGVYAHKAAPGNWVIERVMGSFLPGGGVWETSDVAPGTGVQRDPDVVCAGGRTFVSWFHQAAGPDRLMAAHERSDGTGGFNDPIDLGPSLDSEFFPGSLVLAGVDDTTYAAFVRSDGQLYLKRWTIGAGPGHSVTGHPATVIGGGSTDDPAWSAVIAAADSKVAVAWIRCNSLRFRVSSDRGRTWGPVRYYQGGPGCVEDFWNPPRSINLRGDRIAVTYIAYGLFGTPSVGLVRSTSEFSSFSDQTIAGDQDEHLVGYVTAAGAAKLAAVFDTGDRIRFRRQQ